MHFGSPLIGSTLQYANGWQTKPSQGSLAFEEPAITYCWVKIVVIMRPRAGTIDCFILASFCRAEIREF